MSATVWVLRDEAFDRFFDAAADALSFTGLIKIENSLDGGLALSVLDAKYTVESAAEIQRFADVDMMVYTTVCPDVDSPEVVAKELVTLLRWNSYLYMEVFLTEDEGVSWLVTNRHQS